MPRPHLKVAASFADGYLPKRWPPLLAAFDLGQPEALEAQAAGGAIHSLPNDDDYSERWALVSHPIVGAANATLHAADLLTDYYALEQP